MHIPPELLPVVQITVPLLIGLFLAAAMQNKRIDDLRTDINRQFDQVQRQFDQVQRQSDHEHATQADILAELRAIRVELAGHGERITRLEERIPPLVHR